MTTPNINPGAAGAGGGNPDLEPLAQLFVNLLNQREKDDIEDLERRILLLSQQPDRSTVRDLEGDGDDDLDDGAEPAGRRPRLVERGNGGIVSRRQPTDPLYRALYRRSPYLRYARTPDLDYWNSVWLRAFCRGDVQGMKVAEAKSDEAGGFRPRASTLGGALDASDPTAIASGTGGHLLPQAYSDLVMIAKEAAAVIAPLCTNFNTPGLTLRVPTAGAVTADTVAEGASGAQGEPTFASEMLILHKIGARCIASDEMLEDTAFNLMTIYGERAGKAIGLAEDTQICTTDGVSPNLTEAIAGGNVDEATTTVLVFEDLNTLFFALGKAYQMSAVWLAGTLVCTLLSNMLDTNGGPILRRPDQAPTPVTDATPTAIGTVLGRPIYHVPLTAGTLLLGDLKGYGFVRKGGIVAKMSTDVGFATDTVQFKFTERCDGRIIDDAAMKQMADLATVA